jgi:hypothetical protein
MHTKHTKPSSRPITLPVRLSHAEYDDLLRIATLEQRDRCGMLRRLIHLAARKARLSVPTGTRNGHHAA